MAKEMHNQDAEAARAANDDEAQDADTGDGTQDRGVETATPDLEELQKKAGERDEFLELLQRVRADYANYQKRVQKEIENERRYATLPLSLDLLPVLDNLERAMQAGEAGQAGGLLDGIRMVHQQLLGALARHGIQPISAEGEPFDPQLHEALLEEPSAQRPPQTVIRELARGYRLHDRVVRPSKVVVSRAGMPGERPAGASPRSE